MLLCWFTSLAIVALVQTRIAAATKHATPSSTWEPYFSSHEGDIEAQQVFTSGPLTNLSALSYGGFTTLKHTAFPRYGVRVKKSQFCDGTVDAYTGYIDIEARHLFFYFFESRRDPDHDDVVFWTNGGPGGSSAMGLFMELGPCRVDGPSNTTFHPYSWNEYSNIFFIDQPVGVGFSYADHGESVSTSEEGSKDIAAFVAIFFHHFEKFKGRGFHMAGESYGGRYVPVYASQIYEQNERLESQGLSPVNLLSVMIGNGCTDWSTMFPSYYDMTCTNVTTLPVLSISSCVDFKLRIQRCENWFNKECVERMDAINCKAAFDYCQETTWARFEATGINVYDITKPCIGEFCYEDAGNIAKYLNQPEVQKLIGADPAVKNFSTASTMVNKAFMGRLDLVFPTQYYLTALLERGVRVLLYVGANDFACNWVGNERMSREMEWTGQDQFVKQPLEEWAVDGHAAGLVRKLKGFTFATLYDAGHLVPYDKPIESLEMLKRWLYEDGL